MGHGPFGHFFDEYFLRDFGINHEMLGARSSARSWRPCCAGFAAIRTASLADHEQLDPEQVAWLIQRPRGGG